MSRHHYLNNSTFKHYSNELLRHQVEGALGRGETLAESAAAVDWELGGVRTHPASHASRDEHHLEEQPADADNGQSDGARTGGSPP